MIKYLIFKELDMDNRLRAGFFATMALYKKIETAFASECGLPLNELAILQIITGKCGKKDNREINLDVPDIQAILHISRPAVSYILNSLEKKDYIFRKISPDDRRKIAITATDAGIAAAEESVKKCNGLWEQVLEEFGESDMEELVKMIGRLSKITGDLQE